MRFLFAATLSLLLAYPAKASSFCEEENLVVDMEVQWDFSKGSQVDIPLPTHRDGELFATRAVLHMGIKQETRELLGVFEFPRRPNEVGLPYNLYRLQIVIGSNELDHQLIDQDYTADCSGPGVGLWLGSRLALLPIAITPHADGRPRDVEIVHLRFWGK